MFLFESSRDNQLMPYVELLNSMGIKVSLSQLKQYLLSKFVNEALIRNLSLSSNYYLNGVARYYFEGSLTMNKKLGVFTDDKVKDEFIPEICQRLNALILILRNSFIDSVGTTFEQPEDFGELSLPKLLRKYNKKINEALGIKTEPKNNKEILPSQIEGAIGNGYRVDILYSYEDAKKYNKWTEPGAWCITYGKQHYDTYVRKLGIHYVILGREGFEDVGRKPGPDFPRDEYGNSLIAVLQSNTNGKPIYITSRWNHGGFDVPRCEADHAYNKEQLFAITGINDNDLQNIFKAWQDNRQKVTRVNSSEKRAEKLELLRTFKYAQISLNNGARWTDLFGGAICATHAFTNVDNIVGAVRNKDRKSYDKQVIRGLVSCRCTLNDKSYLFLMDRGKILFNSISEMNNVTFTSYAENSGYIGYPNAVTIKLGGYGSKETYMVYDYVRHRFVEVDGVTKFKGISENWLGEGESRYYELKVSANQTALIKCGVNEPVMLPNGGYWYENSNSKYSIKNVPCVELVYDSAAGIDYFFLPRVCRFLNEDELSPELTHKTDARVNRFHLKTEDKSDYFSIKSFHSSLEHLYGDAGNYVGAFDKSFHSSVEYLYDDAGNYVGAVDDWLPLNNSKEIVVKTPKQHGGEIYIWNSKENYTVLLGPSVNNDLTLNGAFPINDIHIEEILVYGSNNFDKYFALYSQTMKRFLYNPLIGKNEVLFNCDRWLIGKNYLVYIDEHGERRKFVPSETEPTFVEVNPYNS